MIKTIEKPWGYEQIWAQTEKYVGKILHIKSGNRLSLQFHNIKEETVLVISGTLSIECEDSENPDIIIVEENKSFHVLPKQIHRFCAYDGDVTLVEVSTPELEDVIRISDDYDR